MAFMFYDSFCGSYTYVLRQFCSYVFHRVYCFFFSLLSPILSFVLTHLLIDLFWCMCFPQKGLIGTKFFEFSIDVIPMPEWLFSFANSYFFSNNTWGLVKPFTSPTCFLQQRILNIASLPPIFSLFLDFLLYHV